MIYTLAHYRDEHADARHAHQLIFANPPKPYTGEARKQWDAQLLRATNRILETGKLYDAAKDAILAKYADEVVQVGGAK